MINNYKIGNNELLLKSDLASEFPIYIYLSNNKDYLLYSKSIKELLNDSRVIKPLEVTSEGISFLLQSGVVPLPKTVYQNIFIVGIGDTAIIKTINNKIEIDFSHKFPFFNKDRDQDAQVQEDYILEILAEATISRINDTKPSYLFHSAGKDSNSIALALAEAGWQDKVTLITHKSKGEADESAISAKIAKQLGFKHQILYEIDQLHAEHKQSIEDYFVNTPFPCTDNVTLAYPLYAYQIPELQEANLIDGMGNDVFIGHIPSSVEFKRQEFSKFLKYTRPLAKFASSDSLIHVAGRTRSEWTGLFGISYSDASKFFPETVDVSKYWIKRDKNIDYLDFRASLRGTIIDQEIFTRKVRNFSDSINSNLILPWANQGIAKYFAKMPEQYLFDRKELKNKLILRKILKERIGLDSDVLGKMVFSYDSQAVVSLNWDMFVEQILACDLWDKSGISVFIKRLTSKKYLPTRSGMVYTSIAYRLYLISSWYNISKYLKIQ